MKLLRLKEMAKFLHYREPIPSRVHIVVLSQQESRMSHRITVLVDHLFVCVLDGAGQPLRAQITPKLKGALEAEFEVYKMYLPC